MTENEYEELIDVIIQNTKGCSWNFIKTTSTIVDFDNKMKELFPNDFIDRFFVNSINVNNIEKVIKWLGYQADSNKIPIYAQDAQMSSLFIAHPQEIPMFWIIFFRLGQKTI